MSSELNAFTREGDYWTIAFAGKRFRVRHSKGVEYIGLLIRNAGREIHSLDLHSGVSVAAEGAIAPINARLDGLHTQSEAAAEVLDPKARAAYRQRLSELAAELDEANAFNDTGRSARTQQEIEAIQQELASAFGLAGRPRTLSAPAERARVSVRNAIASALRQIAKYDGNLADHLTRTIRTGAYCSYVAESVRWTTVAPTDPIEPSTDRYLATVLRIQIFRSSERAAELGDVSWRELLDQYDALAAEHISSCDGRLVKSFGDITLATFPIPANAMRCAFAITRALKPIGLTIRAGVHTGECVRRTDDVEGIAVHITTAILSLADENEILTSSTVRDLSAGSGVRFEDRGFHALDGIPGSWRLFTAVVGGRRSAERHAKPGGMFSIMLVDDHPMWRETLRTLVEHKSTAIVVAEASDGPEAIELAAVVHPDVVVMDMNLPTMNGADATRAILGAHPDARVLVLSSSDENHDMRLAAEAGAAGYVVKTAGSSEVVAAIHRVHGGETVFPEGAPGPAI